MSDAPDSELSMAAANPALATLDQRQRRRLVIKAAVRVLLTSALLVVVYFAIPVGQHATTRGASVLVIGLIALTAAVVFQIRRIVDAPLPQLRAIETLATAIPVFVVIFALVYVTVSEQSPDAFNQPITHVTGLYFTITVLTTVGFGDVVARTDTARAIVTVQMVFDLAILGGLVRVVIQASRLGLAQRRLEAGYPRDLRADPG